MRRRAFAALGLMAFIAACSPAPKKDAEPTGLTKLKLATDWRAEAELGGYYRRWPPASTRSAASTSPWCRAARP